MYTKLISLVSVILVLCLVSTSFGVVIGDFEDSMDGWKPANAGIQTGFSTNGATLNQKSIWIETPEGNGDALVLDLVANNLVEEFRNNLKVSFDVTRLLSEWVEVDSTWCELTMDVRAGSNEEGGTWVYREGMAGSATWTIEYGDGVMSAVYDYSLAHNQIDYDNLEYLELIFMTNWGGYSPGGVYYIDNVQMFGGGAAYDPIPADGEKSISVNTTIGWTSGVYADKHDVYIGTNLSDVENADRDNPLGVLVAQDYEGNSYNPGTLLYGQSYFWRIDEVNGADIWKGDVWSFTTVYPGSYVLGDWEDNLDGWILYPGADTQLSYSTTGVTLNQKSLKVTVPGSYWVIRLNLNAGQLEALKKNDLISMDVTWVASEWEGQDWAQIQKIAINSAATGWSEVDYPESDTTNPEDPGAWSPAFGEVDTRTLVWDYSDISVANIEPGGWTQINISQNHDSGAGSGIYYFDNMRLINSKIASDPYPAIGEDEVPTQPTLSWESGRNADAHNVYLGDNFDDVNEADLNDPRGVLVSQNQGDNKYKVTIALEYGKTYYWRVDEVTGDGIISKGDIWRFTTGNYIIVDDFEDYNDYPPDEVWNTWIDGYDNPSNGSTAGYPNPDFVIGEHYVETTIVHSGRQSMPIFYDNTAGLSEVTRTLNANWTQNNVATLTLFFYGDAENAAEPLFIALNGNAVVTNSNANAAKVTEWTRWDIPLQTFTDLGVNLGNVRTLSIGLGNKTGPQVGGGSGRMFIDDIRLYRQ